MIQASLQAADVLLVVLAVWPQVEAADVLPAWAAAGIAFPVEAADVPQAVAEELGALQVWVEALALLPASAGELVVLQVWASVLLRDAAVALAVLPVSEWRCVQGVDSREREPCFPALERVWA